MCPPSSSIAPNTCHFDDLPIIIETKINYTAVFFMELYWAPIGQNFMWLSKHIMGNVQGEP